MFESQAAANAKLNGVIARSPADPMRSGQGTQRPTWFNWRFFRFSMRAGCSGLYRCLPAGSPQPSVLAVHLDDEGVALAGRGGGASRLTCQNEPISARSQ